MPRSDSDGLSTRVGAWICSGIVVQHSRAQWPSSPHFRHLPLHRLLPSDSVVAKTSSVVVPLFPPWPDCPHARRLFKRSASSHIKWMRLSVLVEVAP